MEQKWNEHIRKSRQRNWSESKAHSSWQIFKIMAEFVDGFEALAKIGPCISSFGSARTKPGQPFYELADRVSCGQNRNPVSHFMNWQLIFQNVLQKRDLELFQAVVPVLWKQRI